MRRGIRFKPPGVELSPEARWLLARAFAPRGAPLVDVDPIDPARVITLGTTLDLLARIASRTSRDQLADELGPDASAVCRAAFEAACVHTAVQRRVYREVTTVAERLDTPVVFLKGAALDLAGLTTPGSRLSADIDILVSRSASGRFANALIESGYSCPRESWSPNRLPSLRSPTGMAVELHTGLPRIRLGQVDHPDAAELTSAGACEPVSSHSLVAWLPTRAILIAHATVHGVAQHGLCPHLYPFARMLCDLADLDLAAGSPAIAQWHPLIAHQVSRQEAEGCVDLIGRLARCDEDDPLTDPGSPAGFLLRHLLAGTCEDYRKAIDARSVLQRGFATRRRRLLRQAWQAICRADFGPAVRWVVETVAAPWRLRGKTQRV